MDKERLYNWTLEEKKSESIRVIKETLDRFGADKVATTFTGGKDSTVLLVRPGKAVPDSGCDAHLAMPNQQPVASLWSLPGNCQA